MDTVAYTHRFPYIYDQRGDAFPALPLRITRPDRSGHALDIDGYLDSGAQQTLIDGEVAQALGIDLLGGVGRRYQSITGVTIEARIHPVVLSHPELGSFDLDVAFSTVRIRRNLLGRDFFNLIQLGFREHHQVFCVTPLP
ncbi:MAG: hypothetical protein HY699_05690 [Deltaproteobacteria bacterium]|nr:hypothetical protein [Deltaproteobacteria bacterium]